MAIGRIVWMERLAGKRVAWSYRLTTLYNYTCKKRARKEKRRKFSPSPSRQHHESYSRSLSTIVLIVRRPLAFSRKRLAFQPGFTALVDLPADGVADGDGATGRNVNREDAARLAV